MEIWGEENLGRTIDSLKSRFGKIWLKLPYNTSNAAVSRELGMESGISILIKKIIKYYYYISSKENDELVKICLNYYILRSENRGELSLNFRVDRVERLLEKMGLKYLWEKVIRQEDDLKRMLKVISVRCNDIFRQE